MKKVDREIYKDRNIVWLKAKAAESEVYPLDNGVYYTPIAEGDKTGKTPDIASVVTVRYEGRTIDGRMFDRDMD